MRCLFGPVRHGRMEGALGALRFPGRDRIQQHSVGLQNPGVRLNPGCMATRIALNPNSGTTTRRRLSTKQSLCVDSHMAMCQLKSPRMYF